jgi:hypothetical protein
VGCGSTGWPNDEKNFGSSHSRTVNDTPNSVARASLGTRNAIGSCDIGEVSWVWGGESLGYVGARGSVGRVPE